MRITIIKILTVSAIMLAVSLTTTPVEGYLGSRNDEERSEMRYVM